MNKKNEQISYNDLVLIMGIFKDLLVDDYGTITVANYLLKNGIPLEDIVSIGLLQIPNK